MREVEQWLEDEVERLQAETPHTAFRLHHITTTESTENVDNGWLIELDATTGRDPLNEERVDAMLRDLRLLGLRPTLLRALADDHSPPAPEEMHTQGWSMRGSDGSAENALDNLLAILQGGSLSPLELRILLRLKERDASPSSLGDVLDTDAKAIGHATRRLAMRGLIGRRFEKRGHDSHFVLSIGSGGSLKLAPLVARVADTRRSGDVDVILARGAGSPSALRREESLEDHVPVDDRLNGPTGRDPSRCKALR